MSQNPYQVAGVAIPALLGRKREVDTILGRLAEKHICVIGPKYFGKTVLLHGLGVKVVAEHHLDDAVYWDLRHHIPETDTAFYASLAQRLTQGIKSLKENLNQFFSDLSKVDFEAIRFVFEALQEKNLRMLLILDGMDDTLQAGTLTKNVWDNLRSLAEIPSLRLLTGSRQPLRELCSCPESRTSDFWNVFHPEPIRLGAITDTDWQGFVEPLNQAGMQFDIGAIAEVKCWTGGAPLLTAALCSLIWEKNHKGTATKKEVSSWAEDIERSHSQYVDELWRDCSTASQGDLIELVSRGQILKSELNQASLMELAMRGFVHENRDGYRCSNRFIEHHTKRQGQTLPDIKRLFGNRTSYDRNIQVLLELRLSQIQGVDPQLLDFVEMAIRQVNRAHLSIAQVRNIARRALSLIWDVELPNRTIPESWTKDWKHDQIVNVPSGKLPVEDGRQCNVLRLLTDERNSVKPKRTRRSTCLLVCFLNDVGNLGQHPSDKIQTPYAASVSLAAIQLCEDLASP